MSVEIGLISKLLETKDYDILKDKQITAKYFEKEYQPCIRFIDDFYMKNGTVPTIRIFEKKFPNVELETYGDNVGTEEPLAYWCDEIRDKKTHNTIVGYMNEVADMLDSGQVSDAVKSIRKLVNKVELDLTETTAVDTTKDMDDRKKRYEERKRNKGILGIETGIKLLDYMLKGLQPKQLITLMAKTSTGKTWLFILFACYMWLQGYRVMFFTTEMSEEQIEDRLEAMAMGMLYSEFNYSDFKSGKLTPDQEKIYYEFLDTKKGLETFIIDTATTVSSIRAKVELQEADIVFVDSAYLMEDEEGAEADHMRVTHIFRGLKKLAKSLEIPICANTQQDLKSKGGLESVNFAKAITHESDVVMRLERTEEMIEDKEAKIVLEKQREGVLGSVMLNWNFDTMNFGGIYVSQGEKDYTEKEFESGVLGID